MALMWCFIGILLGLFTVAMVFLIIGLREKPKNKNLFRLSQLETDESEIQSPTIHIASEFPESPDVNGRREAGETAKPAKNTTSNPAGKNFPGMGSWSDLLETNPSLYINPLWRGWRDGYQGLAAAQEGEEELNTAENNWGELSQSEPWNLCGVVEGEESDRCDGETSHGDVHGNGGSKRTSSISDRDSQENSGSHGNNGGGSHGNSGSDISSTTININQPLDINPEQNKASTADIDSSRVSTSKTRNDAESDDFAGTIPVGIPSLPFPDSKIFHTEPTRTKRPEIKQEVGDTEAKEGNAKPEVDNPSPEASNAEQQDGNTKPTVYQDESTKLKERKPRSSSGDYKLPSNKLLSKFGLNSEDMGPTSNTTALSSPCLYNKDVNEELRASGKQGMCTYYKHGDPLWLVCQDIGC